MPARIVECTATTVPARAVVRIPPTTSRTCSSSRTITEMTSALFATSAGSAATSAPFSANGAVASGLTSHTTRPPG